jgi:hypothetical protein
MDVPLLQTKLHIPPLRAEGTNVWPPERRFRYRP